MDDKSFFDEETVEKVVEYEESERVMNEKKKKFENMQKTEIMGEANKSGITNEDLLKAYIGKNYDKITGKGFNWAAFLFGGFYMFYRKMYLYGFILMVFLDSVCIYFMKVSELSLMVQLFILLFYLIVIVIVGSTFNAMYLNKSVNKITELQNSISKDKLLEKCKKTGGTSLLVAIVLTIILSGLASFIAVMLNVFAR